ncbi:unnamed protein product [Adineta steineri]|uniref:DYW domain-containing protein n=1 Tax=Adineta steineri TaxID=433720 RepID=A0A819IAP5_9BILA|nr:unnamed protein product [Adineta steineri]CAF3913378.1 unnamed protein product [Adineta steineri]
MFKNSFDSQNNNKGGYNVPNATSTAYGTNASLQYYLQRFHPLKDRLASAAILLVNVYGSLSEFDNASDIRTRLNQSVFFYANPNTTRIQVTKKLRVCDHCHREIKSIALIRKCEIIVRDIHRIHHFHTNRQCSCNDYFRNKYLISFCLC